MPESGRDTYSQYTFWDWASEHYKQVIVCLGNHDFYGYYDLATMPDGYCKQIRHNVHAYYNKILSNQLGYISHGEFLRNGFKLGKMIEV